MCQITLTGSNGASDTYKVWRLVHFLPLSHGIKEPLLIDDFDVLIFGGLADFCSASPAGRGNQMSDFPIHPVKCQKWFQPCSRCRLLCLDFSPKAGGLDANFSSVEEERVRTKPLLVITHLKIMIRLQINGIEIPHYISLEWHKARHHYCAACQSFRPDIH